MLGKLLKHEFHATGRVMWVIYVAMLGLSAMANVALRLLDNPALTIMLVRGVLRLAVVVWVLSLIIGGVATVVLMVKRFHKNLLTDEGYLMFTLPANVHQLVFAKLIAAAVWLVATAAVIALCVLIGGAGENIDIRLMLSFLFNNDLTALETFSVAVIILEIILMSLLSCALSCLQFYSAMSIGHGFANHKVLWSVVFYFIQCFVIQMLTVTAVILLAFYGENVVVPPSWADSLSPLAVWHLTVLMVFLAEVMVGAVFYILTVVNLRRRLNLE